MSQDRDVVDVLDELLRNMITGLTDGGATVTRWLLTYEVSDGDTRIVKTMGSKQLAIQDIAGLLAYATIDTRRAITHLLNTYDPLD